MVHIKIREASNKLVESGRYNRDALKEATEFLQDKWSELQHSISRTSKRMQTALDFSWKKLTHK